MFYCTFVPQDAQKIASGSSCAPQIGHTFAVGAAGATGVTGAVGAGEGAIGAACVGAAGVTGATGVAGAVYPAAGAVGATGAGFLGIEKPPSNAFEDLSPPILLLISIVFLTSRIPSITDSYSSL